MYVKVIVPYPKEKQLDIWFLVGQFGYNFVYENGEITLYGRKKTEEDVNFIKEQLKNLDYVLSTDSDDY